MLQLQAKEIDIGRISKIIAKYNIKASVNEKVIVLYGEISEELLEQLLRATNIYSIQNFKSEVDANTQNEIAIESKSSQTENKEAVKVKLESQVIHKYDLIFPTVKRGEVYVCDFGESYGNEQGGKRFSIIVQNDVGNRFSPTTIVLPCTTQSKKEVPTHYKFVPSDKSMLDYNKIWEEEKENVVLAEQIKTVDKTRLRKYIGTVTCEVMEEIEKIIDISLQLDRRKKIETIDKKEYSDKPSSEENLSNLTEYKDLNIAQIYLLEKIDIAKLLEINQKESSDKVKTEKILQLYGFNMQQNGVQYIFEAILISPKYSYFTLDTLCERISENEPNVKKEEIRRLIVARIKEHFRIKSIHAIDFIRLVNIFLIKKEEQNEETHI